MLKLKKGDQVKVLRGVDSGKTGVIEKIFQKSKNAIVSGVNLYKKHQKAGIGRKSGIFEIAKPLPISALVLICPKCEKPTRVGFKLTATGKFRVCKKCGAQI